MESSNEQPIFTRPYFLSKNEEPESNYILFRKIDMTIRNNNPANYELMYFQITNKSENHIYSNIDIMGENNYELPVCLATFYKHSNDTFGITEILTNSTYLDKMKLKVIYANENIPELTYDYYDNVESYRWALDVNIFIDKDFLLNLYDIERMPKFLFKIIEEHCEKIKFNTFNYNSVPEAISCFSNNNIQKTYKRELFDYQKNNVNWMIQQEFNAKTNKPYKTYKLPKNYFIYNIESINQKLMSDATGQIVNSDNLENINVCVKGGVLSDSVGLGKTFSMLSLVVENLNTNALPTLLFCPTRLCTQWAEEIDKTYDLKYKLIRDIRQYKKLSYDELKQYDIIILSYKFLVSKSYLTLCENEPNKNTLLHNVEWERVICDEGHEYINDMRKKEPRLVSESLFKINSKYRWICSGTPFNTRFSFQTVLNYLTNLDFTEYTYDLDYYRHVIDNLIELLFRRNTKDSVQSQVNIPEPKITTEFLNMSSVERLIYDSALNNNDKKIELCNHIMVSDEHINILGNKPLTLDEIHDKMTLYYKKKIDTYTKRIERLNSDLVKLQDNSSNPNRLEDMDTTRNKLDETKTKLVEVTAKYNIFNDIEEKLNEDEDCPICMESLSTLTKTITPCGHVFCSSCINGVNDHSYCKKIKCAMCRHNYEISDTVVIKDENINMEEGPKLGTKIEHLINTLKAIISEDVNNKIIVFSQWDNMLKLISKILDEYEINHLFLNGSINVINSKIRKFKVQNNINVVLMSSDKSPSGLNLTEASYIILLDTLNTTKEESEIIETQAIGRAVRIGQTKNVDVRRFIMRNTIEHDYYIRNIET